MDESKDTLKNRLNLETGQVAWESLQRFFAQGRAIAVDPSLDLVEVATALIEDDTTRVQRWTDETLVSGVSDGQARQWISIDAYVWSVVVRPWVLVQEIASDDANH